MKTINGLAKVLTVKEQDKDRAEFQYRDAVFHFEKHAKNLYELLKKKETMESKYAASLSNKVNVDDLRYLGNYLQSIRPTIIAEQARVEKARMAMNERLSNLTEHHIDVKKIEKLITKKELEIKKVEEKKEQLFLDEISLRQYIDNKDR
ncbi:flagellar FliJ protein [Gracilibacillus halotolerans]|uniref:Flagellar FliJ protein n=1 Tax=Gracilibacillus halotolerans TaxID=74386 RepID=A0A841RBZ7_9BACI|nr:flagellar export protein FliJ [Gracilibacillus halotolerans]MBB6511440.1 flagellar FliJ protein [Gracilibacillus halotolerans]